MRQRGIEAFFKGARVSGGAGGGGGGGGGGGVRVEGIKRKRFAEGEAELVVETKRERDGCEEEKYGDEKEKKKKNEEEGDDFGARRADANRASAVARRAAAAILAVKAEPALPHDANRVASAASSLSSHPPAAGVNAAVSDAMSIQRPPPSASSSASSSPAQLSSLLVEDSWHKALAPIMSSSSFGSLSQFVVYEYMSRQCRIFPPMHALFSAFNTCPLRRVRVVLIGQDPYHTPGMAMGMCFSVSPDTRRLPPSLVNIFKELKADTGAVTRSGDLTGWALQGVLLLNTVLSVRDGMANSHRAKGWEKMTDACISIVNKERDGVVFVLWGKQAQEKKRLIDTKRHHVLETVHPSPLSAHRGFFGCAHFSTINTILRERGEREIDWANTG